MSSISGQVSGQAGGLAFDAGLLDWGAARLDRPRAARGVEAQTVSMLASAMSRSIARRLSCASSTETALKR